MRCARRALFLAATAFFTLSSHAPAAAFDGFPVCTAGNDQILPITVPDGSGGAIVVWHDSRTTGLIFAQRLGPTGLPLWTPNGVQLSTTADAGTPVAVADGAGGAFIAFGGSSAAPRAQRVSAAGTPQWGADGVAVTQDAGANRHLAIAIDNGGAGGVFVAWRKDLGAGSTPDVYAQKLNSAGALQWGSSGVGIATTNMNTEGNPSIVSDGSGGAMFAWISGAGVRAQRFNAAGASLWNQVTLASSGNNNPPAIVSDGAAGAVIAWGGGGAFTQRVAFDGSRMWNPPLGGVTLSLTGRAPTLIANGAGGAIAAWEDNRAATNFNLYAQKLDPVSGAAQWTANGTAFCMATQNQRSPRIVTDGGAGAIIAWQDERNGPSGVDIYAQRIDGNGASVWLADGVAVSTATNTQDEPTIAIDGAGGAWIAWQDRRSGTNEDVYAARINPNGAALAAPPVARSVGASRAWPTPFAERVTMEFALPAAAAVRMGVYDLAGRMVADLGSANLPSGPHRVAWDGRTLDGRPLGGGVYFIRVEGPGVALSRPVVRLK